jgi:hypothetical protein
MRRERLCAWLGATALLAMGCSAKRRDPGEEVVRREAFVRQLTEREGLREAQGVSDSSDVHYEWGVSLVEYDPKDEYRAHAFRWLGQRAAIRLRSHGDRPMKMAVVGWVNQKVLRTTPTITTTVDGEPLSSVVADDKGFFVTGGIVKREQLKGADWVMLDIDLSSVSWHWADPPELRVAIILSFEWSEAQ